MCTRPGSSQSALARGIAALLFIDGRDGEIGEPVRAPQALPDLSARMGDENNELDLVNLNTAQAATEIWFNSSYHKQTFFILARALVERHCGPGPTVDAVERLHAAVAQRRAAG